jgi:hypothetical protein
MSTVHITKPRRECRALVELAVDSNGKRHQWLNTGDPDVLDLGFHGV